MYHVNADNRFPYWVCGGQQESGSACVSSRGNWGAVTERDWHTVGAEEYGYVVPDPLHPGTTFRRQDREASKSGPTRRKRSRRSIRPSKYRTVRTSRWPSITSTATVYTSARTSSSRPRTAVRTGASSAPILPARIRAFRRCSVSSKPTIRKTATTAASCTRSRPRTCTRARFGPAPTTGRCGSRVTAAPDWKNITPPGLTPWSKVSQIDASRVDDDTAFVAVNRFRLNDLRPYVYVTHDGGAHWELRTSGLPEQPVNAVRQDPEVPNLLYAATENGVVRLVRRGRAPGSRCRTIFRTPPCAI